MTVLEISTEVTETLTALTQDLFAAENFVDSAREAIQKGNAVLILLNKLDSEENKQTANVALGDFETSLASLDETKLSQENLNQVFTKIKERCEGELDELQSEVLERREQVQGLEAENADLRARLANITRLQEAEMYKMRDLEESLIKRDLELNSMQIELTAASKERDYLREQVQAEQKNSKTLTKKNRVLAMEVNGLRDVITIKDQEIKSLQDSHTEAAGKMTQEMEECLSTLKTSANAVSTLSLIRGTMMRLGHDMDSYGEFLESVLPAKLELEDTDFPDIEIRNRSNEQLDVLLGRLVSYEEESSDLEECLVELSKICVHMLKKRIQACKLLNNMEAESLREKYDAQSGGIISDAVSGVGNLVSTSVSYVPILGSLLVTPPQQKDTSKEEVLESQSDKMEQMSEEPDSSSDTPSEGRDATQFWNPIDLDPEENYLEDAHDALYMADPASPVEIQKKE